MFGSPVILVVEDEAPIRIVIAIMLEDAGYEVIEAANAEEALAVMGVRQVSVLFTDVNMPGRLNGLELAEHVHERWPDVALLVASGALATVPSAIPCGGQFVPKPYRVDQIVREIDRLVGRAR